MELAMHCRDSGSRGGLLARSRSEWTTCVRLPASSVAFPCSVRQRLFGPGEKPREKVAVPSGVVL